MDFLFKDRGSGKRAIKPSKEAEILDALIPDQESDDSDFELDKHGGGDSEAESDSGKSKSGSGSSSESSSDDSEDGSVDEDEALRLKANLTTEELIQLAQRRAGGSGQQDSGPSVRICGTCLSSHSDHTNEIVECDGCGVAVHEACYGIQESGSVASNASSACTEPWFCEPCMAGVHQPPCEVCPNIGGIYKETDVGSWIHLICALYVPYISFFDQERITRATLFELNYQAWGRRSCALCRDIKFARTGLCIECDAGMCRQYFHVTCAQEAGLLSEPSADDHEQFFGHCKAHSDKELIRKRKKNWLTHQLNYRQRAATIAAEREADRGVAREKETASQRNVRKLSRWRERWLGSRERENWVPTQKMPRLLLTSSKAIRKFQRKAELHEWNVEAMEEEEHNKQVVAEIRKKWHLQPAWSVEFVAYYHDRQVRLKEFQEKLAAIVILNNQLKDEDDETCSSYRQMVADADTGRGSLLQLRATLQNYKNLLQKLDPQQRDFTCSGGGPSKLASPPMKASCSTAGRRAGPGGKTTLALHSCKVCRASSDQHLLAHCDVCKLHYHLGCLRPPLIKMPKKTRQYGWQCSECDRVPEQNPSSFKPADPAVDLEAPRSSRTRTTRTGSIQGESDITESSLLKSHETATIPCDPSDLVNESKSEAVGMEPQSFTSTPLPASVSPSKAKRGSTGRKRGRPFASNRKDSLDKESPPVKIRRGRKSNESKYKEMEPVTEPVVTEADTSVVAKSELSQGEREESVNKNFSPPLPLPPKKLFINKAAIKETEDTEPADSERTNFKNWLDAKLSNSISDSSALNNGTGPEDQNLISCEFTDESSGDETSPEKNGSFEREDKDSKKERKRLKREEKEKRKQERRKKKMLKSHGVEGKITVPPGNAEIEEDDESCVVRIAPKPIKIKIKPISKPTDDNSEQTNFAIVNEGTQEDEQSSGCQHNQVNSGPGSLATHMHPKKKIAHMDSLVNNYPPLVTNLIHSTLPYLPPEQEAPCNSLNSTPSSPPSSPFSSLEARGNGSVLGSKNGLSDIQSGPEEFETQGDLKDEANTPSLSKSKLRRTANSDNVRKSRDSRTKCDVCLGDGNNANLVRCDECLRCFHFGCLNPPVKKTPKVSGWAWACSDCAPSDEDKGWHL